MDWYYDDMKIIDAEGTELTFNENGVATLTIEDVCVEDEGDYSVQGVNDEGAVSKTVRLQVAGLLDFVDFLVARMNSNIDNYCY